MQRSASGPVPVTVTYDREGAVVLSPPRRIPLQVSPELASVFGRAGKVNAQEPTPLSFTSLLLALLVGEDDTGLWLARELGEHGVTPQALLRHRGWTIDPAQWSGGSTELPSDLGATVSARRALEEAQAIAASLGHEVLEPRHLVAAYPVLRDWHDQDFRELGIDRLRWCRSFGAHMADGHAAERWFWRSYADRASPVPLTSFSADVYTEKDLVGIDRTVDALALLIASTRTDTPLSIGVFGPWGSGKSFFMRHLRRRIWGLAGREKERVEEWVRRREAGTATDADAPLYYGQVAQVEFNAWHYNEGNLVASLVDHLFRNLRVAPDSDESDLAKRRQFLLEQITHREVATAGMQQSIDRARRDIEVAKEGVQRVSDEIAAARKTVAERARELAEYTAQAETARRESEKALQDLGEAPAIDAAAFVAVALAPVEGSPALAEARQAGRTLLEEINDWRQFAAGLFTPRGAAVALLVAAVPVVTYVTEWLNRTWSAVAGIVAAAAAGGSQVVTFLRERRREYEARMKEVEEAEARRRDAQRERLRHEQQRINAAWQQRVGQLRQRLETQRQQIAEREQALAAAVQDVAAISRQLDEKVRARADAEEELKKLRESLAGLSHARLLDEFIQERSASDDYRKQLGFLALVRRDFERLSDLISRVNGDWCAPNRKGAPPAVNRIVLYIDDLDRCKVETVIQVLEAVHLLLAFPLFVCVVAVDPRWIEHCLRQRHSHLFSRSVDGNATVGDYLEKIFQIPIWMQPIGHRQRASLVRTLLGSTAAPPPRSSRSPGRDDPQAEAALPPKADESSAGADGFQRAVARAEATPDPLHITREEAAFVDRIAPLLSEKPRALKRFVNTYRLLKASLADLDRRTFVTDSPASAYKLCMSQLALFTGQPRLAPLLVRQLNAGGTEAPTLGAWARSLGPADGELAKLLARVPDADGFPLEEFRAWLPETSRYLFHRDD